MAHAPTVPTLRQQLQMQQTLGAGARPDLRQQRRAAGEAVSRNRRQADRQSHDHGPSASYLGFRAARLLANAGRGSGGRQIQLRLTDLAPLHLKVMGMPVLVLN